MNDSAANAELLGWCVVANVAEPGVKHFAAGAKVWVLRPQWDSKEHLFVVGRHRGAHKRGYIRIVIPREHLTNFRVRGIYEQAVVDVATAYFDGLQTELKLWESREQAERCAEWWHRDDTRMS